MIVRVLILVALSGVVSVGCGNANASHASDAAMDRTLPFDALALDATNSIDVAFVCTDDVCCPASGPVLCGTDCTDPMTDSEHCGDCGTVCSAGAFCVHGLCACSSPQMDCPIIGCIDVTIDSANCGGCGVECPSGAPCTDGACITPCPAGTHRCAGACVSDDAITSCGTLCAPCTVPMYGTAACVAGNCQFTCVTGYHPCGLTCAHDTDLATCGTSCVPCPTPTHGLSRCTAAGCGALCDPGYHPCGGLCADDTSTLSCGGSCTPCPLPDHATANCTAGACAFTCDSGYHACGAVCSDGNDPMGCGPTCAICPTPANGAATCTTGTCGFTCGEGFHACGTACVGDSTVSSCGSLCTPCPLPSNSTATCTGGVCGFTCVRGYVAAGSGCIELPRPISPWNTATVTSRRPALEWFLPPAAGDAVVELCMDPLCSTVLTTLPAVGGTGTPSVDLPAGTVFWRVRYTATSDSSPVWQFTVTARSGAITAAWGTGMDLNADGFADVLAGSPMLLSPGSRAYVYVGSPTGLQASPPTPLNAPDEGAEFALSLSSAGDVDGDGYSDVIIGAPSYMDATGRAYVYVGGAGGLIATPVTVLTGRATLTSFASSVAGVGDIDGDGYADVVVGAYNDGAAGTVYVYPGSVAGTVAAAATTLTGPDGSGGRFGIAVAAAGDVNADGYADVLVGADGIDGYMGRAYVYLGSAIGLVTTPEATLTAPAGGQFGYSLAGVGDVNGDGYPDVAIGALTATMGVGAVYVYPGGPMGITTTPIVTLAGPDGTGTQFGGHLAPAGDINGDGFADMVVGAPLYMSNQGRAYFYRGGLVPATTPTASLVGAGVVGTYFGTAVDAGRDVNGDGFPDALVSADRAAGFTGVLYVYPGGASGLGTPIGIIGPDPGGQFGYTLACGHRVIALDYDSI